jgi:hypothetical protein
MSVGDAGRLIQLAVSTAVQLLERQDGILFPIAHAVDSEGRIAFIGAYNGAVCPDPATALRALHHALRARPYRSTAIVYGTGMPDESGRDALCIEFESLDAAPETIFVPFVITRPWLRQARVITYAPVRFRGRNNVLRPGQARG